MRERKTTQYPWGTERPLSKLEKIEAWHCSLYRDIALIRAQAKRDEILRLRQNWVDVQQINHIKAATKRGSYFSGDAAAYPWVEECEDQELNSALAKAEEECNTIELRKTPAEIEREKSRAGVAAVRNRLCHLAAHLGCPDPEIERKITERVPGRVVEVIEMLGLELNSEEVYFAFYGLEETVHLPDGTLGHPDFDYGWSNALRPPTDFRAAFPSCHILTVSPELMPEDAAWHWVRPLLFKGDREMPPSWRQSVLQPYGGSAVTALATLLKTDAALKGRYLAEQARQFMWPFFVERREKLRFYLRLYQMEDIELDEIQQAMAEFDERESPLRAAASALKLADHEVLAPNFSRIFKRLPWPDGFGPSS